MKSAVVSGSAGLWQEGWKPCCTWSGRRDPCQWKSFADLEAGPQGGWWCSCQAPTRETTTAPVREHRGGSHHAHPGPGWRHCTATAHPLATSMENAADLIDLDEIEARPFRGRNGPAWAVSDQNPNDRSMSGGATSSSSSEAGAPTGMPTAAK